MGPLVAVRLDGGKGPHTEDLRRRSASDGHRTVLSSFTEDPVDQEKKITIVPEFGIIFLSQSVQ